MSTTINNIKDTHLIDTHALEMLILEESNRQLEKWGTQDCHIFEWAMWTTEEFGEFIQAVNEYAYGRSDSKKVIKEGVQTITLLMKILDSLLQEAEG